MTSFLRLSVEFRDFVINKGSASLSRYLLTLLISRNYRKSAHSWNLWNTCLFPEVLSNAIRSKLTQKKVRIFLGRIFSKQLSTFFWFLWFALPPFIGSVPLPHRNWSTVIRYFWFLISCWILRIKTFTFHPPYHLRIDACICFVLSILISFRSQGSFFSRMVTTYHPTLLGNSYTTRYVGFSDARRSDAIGCSPFF